MKSIQHVLWRGALALGLMAVGIGSGLGLPRSGQASSPEACAAELQFLATTDRAAPARFVETGAFHGAYPSQRRRLLQG